MHLRKALTGTPAIIIAIGLMAGAVLVPVAIRLFDDLGRPAIPLIAFLFVGVTALFLIPVTWLPAAAIVLFAVIPDQLTPGDGVFSALPMITAVVVIWVLRRVVLRQGHDASPSVRLTAPRAYAVLAAVFFLIWTVFTTVMSDTLAFSISWIISITLGAFLVMLVPNAHTEARLLREAWIITGFAVGIYAGIEIALGRSPLFDPIYSAFGDPVNQHWSVYRAVASFGHPIAAGAYLAPAAVLGIVRWLETGRMRYLVFGGGAAIGVVATVTRGSIAALAIGLLAAVLGILLFGVQRSVWRLGLFTVGGALAAFVVLRYSPLAERTASSESAGSTVAREIGFETALKASEFTGWLGSGAGTSGITGRLFNPIVIESSVLQLMISVGIPGLALFLLVVGALLVNSLRGRDVASAAAILTFIIAISNFNAIDAVRSLHLLIGLLFLLGLFPEAPPALTKSTTFLRPAVGWRSASPLLAPARGAGR